MQTITISATGGNFDLAFGGETTASAIAVGATAATVATALVSLSTVPSGSVAVSLDASVANTYTYSVVFTGAHTMQGDVGQITVSSAALTGGAQTSSVATTTDGDAANAAAAHIVVTEIQKGTLVPFGAGARSEASGAAYVFERDSTTTWVERAKLRPLEPSSQGGVAKGDSLLKSRFGHAVAISSNVIFVGAPSENSGDGAAYIFERLDAHVRPESPALPPWHTPEEEWMQVQRIGKGGAIEETTVDGEPSPWARALGAAGAMYEDMLVVAAPGAGFGGYNGSADAGADIAGTAAPRVGVYEAAVYVLRRTVHGPVSALAPSGLSYVLDQTLRATVANSGFGSSVAVLADTIVVGAPYYGRDVTDPNMPYGSSATRSTEQGAVYVYRRANYDRAFTMHQILTASDGIPGARLGLSTALTARGDVVLASASARTTSGALLARAAVQEITTHSTGGSVGGTFVVTFKTRRLTNGTPRGVGTSDVEFCYPESDVPCHADEMKFRCQRCPGSAVPGAMSGLRWRPRATKRLPFNIGAAELAIELQKLGTKTVNVVRSASDSRGGYRWRITFVSLPGETVAALGVLGSELTTAAGVGTSSIAARVVMQPLAPVRGNVYAWTDEANHATTETSSYVEQALLMPNAYQQADLFGSGGIAADGEVLLAGAPNRDSFVSGVNAGATYAFSLDFLNFRFGRTSYAFEEDEINATVQINRCGGGGDNWNAFEGCRIGPLNDRGLGLQRTSVISYATGDSASPSHVSAALLQREMAHVPVGTARGRAECFANSSNADCLWILDPAVNNISTYDETGVSDYVPAAAELSFASGETVTEIFISLTNDHHVEVPDETFHLRLTLPGMVPSYGGSLWTTITIIDDGDGGHGGRDYFERLLPPPTDAAWKQSSAVDGKSYDPPNAPYASSAVDWMEMGSAVAIDNSAVIVGAPRSEQSSLKNVGSAFTYFRYSGVWERKQTLAPPAGAVAGGLFGSAVALRNDVMLVGARGLARVYVYEFQGVDRQTGTWAQTATLRPPTPAEVTARGGDDIAWAPFHQDTTSNGAGYGDLGFGARGSIALSNDHGSDAFGGGGGHWWAAIGNVQSEAVYVYERTISGGGTWDLRQIVRSNDFTATTILAVPYLLRPRFGEALAMSGRTIAVGAPREDEARHSAGNVSLPPHDPTNPAAFSGRGAVYVRHALPRASVLLACRFHAARLVLTSAHTHTLSPALFLPPSLLFFPDFLPPRCAECTVRGAVPRRQQVRHQASPLVLSLPVRSPRSPLPPARSLHTHTHTHTRARARCSSCEEKYRYAQHAKLAASELAAGDQFGASLALDNDQLIVGARANSAVPRASWDFELGDLRGWTLTGTAFNNQPTLGDNTYARNNYGENLVTSFQAPTMDWLRSPIITFHGDPGRRIGAQGVYWVGTYENRRTNGTAAGEVQGDAPVGTMTSPPFIIGGMALDTATGARATTANLQIGFLVGGGCRAKETYVELLVDGEDDPLTAMRTAAQSASGQGATSTASKAGVDAAGYTNGMSVLRATGRCEEAMRRVWWNVTSFAGRSARLRIVDSSKTHWGHINFDDVLFSWHGPGLAMQGGLGMSAGASDLGTGQTGSAGAAYAFRRKSAGASEERCMCTCTATGCSCDGAKWSCDWQEQSKLQASDQRSGDLFGFAVDVDDASGVVVIGAPGRSGTDQVRARAISSSSFVASFLLVLAHSFASIRRCTARALTHALLPPPSSSRVSLPPSSVQLRLRAKSPRTDVHRIRWCLRLYAH